MGFEVFTFRVYTKKNQCKYYNSSNAKSTRVNFMLIKNKVKQTNKINFISKYNFLNIKWKTYRRYGKNKIYEPK